MKFLVVFYSHRGTTAYIARRFSEALKTKGEVDIFELKYLGGKKSLIERFFYRFNISSVQIISVPTDLREYDVLYLGISVLGGYPSSAISKYITLLENVDNKKIICCYVYGIEGSVKHCSQYIQKLLKKKGYPNIIDIHIPWYNVFKEGFLDGAISFALSKL